MIKSDIINEIVNKTGLERVVVQATVEAFMDSVKQTMINGGNIYLRGFCTFHLKKRAAKKARNISKGTSVNIPAHYIPAFKPSKEFAKAVKTSLKAK
jgi:DNA-binding protein HU-beta